MAGFGRAAPAAWLLIPIVLSATGCGEAPTSASTDPFAATRSSALAGPSCEATGAHIRHGTFACATCHSVPGSLCFDPAGPAVAPGQPSPSFDFEAKTCSSVACHGLYSGTFSYWFWNGDGESELRTVSYAGAGGDTPSWYATGAGCTACHGNPPAPYAQWHGWHAGRSFAGSNDCQLCHPDAIGANGVATGINTAPCTVDGVAYASCAALHANGTVNVNARFRTMCFNCH